MYIAIKHNGCVFVSNENATLIATIGSYHIVKLKQL